MSSRRIRTPEYRSWEHMIARCHSASDDKYRRYGGRGITVCAEWRNDFARFLLDMGPRPIGTTLDRVDVDGNYEPRNCRWATRAEQNREQRARALKLVLGDEELTLYEASRRVGLHPDTLRNRLKRGLSVGEACSRPLRRSL